MKIGVPSTLRIINKSLVLNVIRESGPISRAQISKKTNITRATVSEIAHDLLGEQVIFESGSDDTPVGRKGILLNYNSNLGYGLSVDLGGTKISFALFNLNAELLARKKIATYRLKTNDEFISSLTNSIREFISEHKGDLSKLQVIGIATPGIVDNKNGIVVEGSPNLPGWENLNLSERIIEAFGVPVVLENDVRAALIGEVWKGKCREVQSAILIALGTGIGSALLMDGNIIRGAGNAAGEIGYMMFGRDQLRLNWGNKGCFESLYSGSGLIEQANRYCSKEVDGVNWNSAEDIFTSARMGDSHAKEIIKELTDYLSISILNLITVVNPEVIVLMGGISNSSDLFLKNLNENIRKHTFTRTNVNIVVSDLKELAPLYGMSILALNKVQPSIHFLEEIKLI